MKQGKLKLEPKATDRECAEIIKADPSKYPSVLMQEWAATILAGEKSSHGDRLHRSLDRIMAIRAHQEVEGI